MAVPAQDAGSVSRVACLAQIRGKGDARIALFRHLTPLTVDAIVGSMPIDSRVSVQAAMVSLLTTLKVGVEKQASTFERGDVAFLASGSLLCVFLKGVKSDRPLNPVGKVESGIEVFDAMRPGDVVRLSIIDAQKSG